MALGGTHEQLDGTLAQAADHPTSANGKSLKWTTGTAESAIANKQFMGELHEMSMVNTTKKRFSINNLTPNIDSTLFYFRFEEVDE